MVNEFKDASGTTTATAGRTPHDESKSAKSNTIPASAKVDRAIHFNDFETSDQDSEEDGSADYNDAVVFSHEAEERSLQATHVSNSRGVERRRSMTVTEKMREVKE